ncbi:MAG: L-threonylcarbamoyladenylate synthase [Pyrinomonadaceae bacterium]
METLLTQDPYAAAEFIRSGRLVAFPTETVYGLGANMFDPEAVTKIFEAKRRPPDNPLIAHISDIDQIALLTSDLSAHAARFIEHFFPGPLTLVLPRSERVPDAATAGLDTIGVRMPRFPLARRFIEACGVPIVAPSANLSGRPSPTTWQAVQEDLDGRIDCILQGDATEIGLESTVVDCTGAVPMLLRQGAVSLAELRLIVPEIRENVAGDTGVARSPGLRHKHYSPRAKVMIVNRNITMEYHPGSAYIGLDQQPVTQQFSYSKVCNSIDEYAHSLFEFFRECDRKEIHTIYCEEVPATGIGAALMDRLQRAAQA